MFPAINSMAWAASRSDKEEAFFDVYDSMAWIRAAIPDKNATMASDHKHRSQRPLALKIEDGILSFF
jgi:hypothetical protein